MRDNPLTRLLARLEHSRLAPLLQFIKFSLVGVSNTAISYGVEMLCYYVLFRDASFAGTAGFLSGLGLAVTGEQVRIVLTNVIAFLVSVTNAYYWNSRYVFGKKGERDPHPWRTYFRTMASYALTGLVLAPLMKVWLEGAGVPYWAASLLTLAVTIPLNYVINKFWAFRRRGGETSGRRDDG